MPEETYSIGFGKNDFFYSLDKEKQKNLLDTIPFNKIDTLKEWCKTKITSDTDKAIIGGLTTDTNIIFNPIISDIILDTKNREDFINNYMPGNISINNNFNSLALNMMASNALSEQYNAPIRGNIEVTTNNSVIPTMYIDIPGSSSSTLDYSTQNGKLNPGITVNANVLKENTNPMLEYKPKDPVQNPDGTTRNITVSANTRNPRCKFVNNCTENHDHYESCTTIIEVDKDGQSHCKCACTGKQDFNPDNKPHSHCEGVDINENGSNTGGLNTEWVTNYLKDTTLMGVINNIKMNLTATVMGTSSAENINGNLFATYTNSGGLKDTDFKIRDAIYNYYAEVIKNRNLQADIMDKQTFNNTANLISQDATQNYRKQYLELFNVTTGIFLASAYIYISMK